MAFSALAALQVVYGIESFSAPLLRKEEQLPGATGTAMAELASLDAKRDAAEPAAVEPVGAAAGVSSSGTKMAKFSNFVNWFPVGALDHEVAQATSGRSSGEVEVNHSVAWYNFKGDHLKRVFAAGYGAKDVHSTRVTEAMAFLQDQPNCTVLVGLEDGNSDGPDHMPPRVQEECTKENQKIPILATWEITPPLDQLNAFDIKTYIVLDSISQLRRSDHEGKGIYHKMEFEIARTGGSGFWGQMGPIVMGGSSPEEGSLLGRHVFHMGDTALPATDRSYVRGRRLVLPGHSKAGDMGRCTRSCLGCDSEHGHAEMLRLNFTTGVSCSVEASMDDGHAFVYRIYMSQPSTTVLWGGTTWMGQEWEVTATDVLSGSHYVVGRVVLESNTAKHGIKHWINKHVHLGCTHCFAAYEAYRVVGPFILSPARQHLVRSGSVRHMPEAGGEECDARRGVAVGGLEVLYESGPGVAATGEASKTFDADMRIFECK